MKEKIDVIFNIDDWYMLLDGDTVREGDRWENRWTKGYEKVNKYTVGKKVDCAMRYFREIPLGMAYVYQNRFYPPPYFH